MVLFLGLKNKHKRPRKNVVLFLSLKNHKKEPHFCVMTHCFCFLIMSNCAVFSSWINAPKFNSSGRPWNIVKKKIAKLLNPASPVRVKWFEDIVFKNEDSGPQTWGQLSSFLKTRHNCVHLYNWYISEWSFLIVINGGVARSYNIIHYWILFHDW